MTETLGLLTLLEFLILLAQALHLRLDLRYLGGHGGGDSRPGSRRKD